MTHQEANEILDACFIMANEDAFNLYIQTRYKDETYIEAIPPYGIETLRDYIYRGQETGDFLRAVISNDLMEAFGRADPQNREALHYYIGLLYNFVPRMAWGSPEAYKNWLKIHQLAIKP